MCVARAAERRNLVLHFIPSALSIPFSLLGFRKFVGPFTSFIGEGRRSQRAPSFSSSSSSSNSVKLIQLVLLLQPKFNKLLAH
jgi:hypothetical protein